mmetsp:Transcript_44164/g.86654  ORF Transcript_44164/g.86654 Transcript_44164/m.86654 type:complete len:292 (-) Transcript_44164:546-1421(-)
MKLPLDTSAKKNSAATPASTSTNALQRRRASSRQRYAFFERIACSRAEASRRRNVKRRSRAPAAANAASPFLDHLTAKDYKDVYEPSDDTFLLMDALSSEAEAGCLVTDAGGPLLCLEIGCGSGAATAHLSNAVRAVAGGSTAHLVTDVNPRALRATERTVTANGALLLGAVRCDLAGPLLPGIAGCVDVLLFNPPYVPTPDDEAEEGRGGGISAAWAGGIDGRRIVDRALPQIAALLSKTGCAYVVTVDENRPEEMAWEASEEHKLDCVPVMKRRAANEYLSILRFKKRE